MPELTPILDLMKADVRDGDRLIVRVTHYIPPEVVAQIREGVKAWARADVTVLVLHPSDEISIEIDRYGEPAADPEPPPLPEERETPLPLNFVSCQQCGKPAHAMHIRNGICVMCLAIAGAGEAVKTAPRAFCSICGRPYSVGDGDTMPPRCPPCRLLSPEIGNPPQSLGEMRK